MKASLAVYNAGNNGRKKIKQLSARCMTSISVMYLALMEELKR